MSEKEDESASVEELVFRLVRVGRAVATEILTSDLGVDSRQGPLLERCLRRLSNGQPLDARDGGGLETVRGILRREVDEETLGSVWEFQGVHDPEIGDVGTVRLVRLVTERGEALAPLLAAFEHFLEARQELLDRVRVDNVLASAHRN